MANKRLSILFLAILGGIFSGVFFQATAQAQTTRRPGGTMKIKLYFVPEDWNYDNLVAVERRIPKTRRIADAALRELFKGVNEAESKRGLFSAYSIKYSITGREGCGQDVVKPLAAYYIGVRIKKGVATVNFRAPAECYLQTAIFTGNAVVMPIEATLKQFKSIREVQFALEGVVITEWDA